MKISDMEEKQFDRIRLVLGDQLNISHSWYEEPRADTLYVLAELKQETDYAKHHIQKVCAFFAAMENFATALEKTGHQVLHLTLDETSEYKDLTHLISHLCSRFGATVFQYQRPDEYRLLQQMRSMTSNNGKDDAFDVFEFDTEHFLLPFEEIDQEFKAGKHNLMESFYRKMRKRFGVLMEDGKPLGGKWNYDHHNRSKLKTGDIAKIPPPLVFSTPVAAIKERLLRHDVVTIGESGDELLWPVNRHQAVDLLNHFCTVCLPRFGVFQDAMTDQIKHKWSLYHSRLSFALNSKMLHPMQVIQSAMSAYCNASPSIDLAQIEGFVRQILGWREYVRGVYWTNMPNYMELNELNATRDLPSFFWTGDTKMSCMKQAIEQSLEYAYAHHIQRLMVTGNFALLAGIEPQQVDDWYLGIYIDAIEWVEAPNTRGMALHADGGMIATKPYAASGNYINKMSDYCKGCHYNVKEKTSQDACPFNSLYWRFIETHRAKFSNNPRMGMMYRQWEKMADADKRTILDRAESLLANINQI